MDVLDLQRWKSNIYQCLSLALDLLYHQTFQSNSQYGNLTVFGVKSKEKIVYNVGNIYIFAELYLNILIFTNLFCVCLAKK